MKQQLIFIAHWQIETVLHKDREFTFSPFGLDTIDGWILMSWQRIKVCDMGHRHAVERWCHVSWPTGSEQKNPHVPRDVWRKLAKKTEDAVKRPWPGGD